MDEKIIDLTLYMNKFISGNVTPNATIRGELVKIQQITKRYSEKDYFFLKDICDPVKLYLSSKYPERFEPTIDTKKIFSIGNRIHGTMGKAIEKMDDFIDTEAILDGHLIGIPVRGRIDAETKNAIFEFKSKNELPVNPQEIIERYPQDVEQLGFYSFLDPIKRKENYLIFVSQDGKYTLRAFKLTTKSFKGIERELRNRVELLKKVFSEEEHPSVFFKCRYCKDDCSLKTDSLCELYKNKNPKCSIKDFVEITRDEIMEKYLNELIELKGFENLYSIFNIITSRKTLNKSINELELEPEELEVDESEKSKYMEKKKNKTYFEEIVYKAGLSISAKEYKNILKNNKIPEIYLKKSNFIKIGDKIYPTLIHSTPSIYSSSLRKPHSYKIGELSILSILTGFATGYILIYYPNISDEIRAFEVKFVFPNEPLREIKKIVEILKSKDISKINELPECPSFIHENDCKFKNICLEKENTTK